MLFRTLNIGASGLRAAQAGLATVGHNIANVDVEGYSRQRVELGAHRATVLGYRASFFGNGVGLLTVGRADDTFHERQVRLDSTALGFFQGRASTLDAVERLFAGATEPDLGGAMDAFFNSARELSQEPADLSVRRSFVQAAQGVASGFNVLERELRTARRGIDDSISDGIDKVNELARTIASMNAGIVSGEVDARQANDLRDTRDQAIRELSSWVDVNAMAQPDGSVTVEIQGGNLLVQGDQFARLQGTPDGANGGLLELEYVGLNNNVVSLAGVIDRGALGGLLDVRDARLGADLAALDTLAETFANTVNAQHRAGFGQDGIGNRDLFLPPAAPPGTAANLAVDPGILGNPQFVAAATDPLAASGDNRNLLLLADLQNAGQPALGNATFNRRYGQLLHDVGRAAADNASRMGVARVKAEQSESLRESIEGVSIDDEMVELTKFQKHFEANAKMITTIDELLDSVMQLIQ